MNTYLLEWQNNLLGLLPKLIIALIIFVASLYLARLAGSLIKKVLKRREVNSGAENLIAETARWSIIVYGTIMALQQFADVTAFLAGLGILGFTVGFALQDVMKNFAAGVLLLLQKPFRVGDSILVADFSGTVMAIDLRSTEIKTVDGLTAILPNADVLNHAIVNYTRSVNRRIELPVSVALDADLDRVRELTLGAVQKIPGLLGTPAPQAVFQAFGHSSVHLLLHFWVDTSKIELPAAQDAALKLLKQSFDENGIVIPHPTQTVVLQK